MSCQILHEGQLSDSIEVKTGVRQGCLLSPMLFLLAIDWIMKSTTAGMKTGIQWSLMNQLDDLDFADDIALLSHSSEQMQTKTNRLNSFSQSTGLKINIKKTKLLKINTGNEDTITVEEKPVEAVESFTYLGSIVDQKGGTESDVKSRIGKARAAFIILKKLWQSKTCHQTQNI